MSTANGGEGPRRVCAALSRRLATPVVYQSAVPSSGLSLSSGCVCVIPVSLGGADGTKSTMIDPVDRSDPRTFTTNKCILVMGYVCMYTIQMCRCSVNHVMSIHITYEWIGRLADTISGDSE